MVKVNVRQVSAAEILGRFAMLACMMSGNRKVLRIRVNGIRDVHQQLVHNHPASDWVFVQVDSTPACVADHLGDAIKPSW